MTMPVKPQIFLDTSALLAAILSATGGGRELLRLGEAQFVTLLASQDVLSELDQVLRRKSPSLLTGAAILLNACRIVVTPPLTISTVQYCQRFVQYANDAVVLAGAVDIKADYFVSLDRKHFLDNSALHANLSLLLGTPGDCLVWYRDRLAKNL